MPKKPFTFKNTRGVEYTVLQRKPNTRLYGEADGTCADPKEESPKIHISPYLTPQSELNTSIHEFAHAFFWDKSETDITKFANAISRYLFNHRKWRRIKNERRRQKKK